MKNQLILKTDKYEIIQVRSSKSDRVKYRVREFSYYIWHTVKMCNSRKEAEQYIIMKTLSEKHE